MPTDKMAGSNHLQWASSPRSSQKKKLLINDIVSEDHQISEEFFNILGWSAFRGLSGLACAINSNLIKICRLEQFQLKAWVFRAPTLHFFHGLLVKQQSVLLLMWQSYAGNRSALCFWGHTRGYDPVLSSLWN